MSHFSVLVIGPDVDGQLARFHEFECTGTDNQYVQDIDQTQEVLAAYEDHKHDPDYPTLADFVEHYYGIETVAHGAQPDTAGTHKFGYALLDEQGAITTVVKRTNPDKKWDWYVIGGRWDGYFTLKNGRSANQARKGDIDLDRMRADADAQVRKTYAETGYHPGLSWRTWEAVLADTTLGDIDKKRAAYHHQPDLQKVQATHKAAAGPHAGVFFDYDTLLGCDADAYVAATSGGGITPYALVHEGRWCAKGEMGWFGLSRDDTNQANWTQQVRALIDSLPDDTLLTAVDCHI